MFNSRDYRHSNYTEYDGDDYVVPRRAGSKPMARKVKAAGFCSEGYALFYVNGAEESEHVLTPADTSEIAHHKKKCNKGRGVGS